MKGPIKHIAFSLLAVALMVSGCGKEKSPTKDPVIDPGPGPDAELRLVMFGASWCATCSRDIPIVQSQLKNELGANLSKVQMELWVPTGATPAQRPEEAVTKAYGDKLNFSGPVTSDAWRWKYFRELLPGAALALPAAAIVDLNGNVIKRYLPNTFNPADIVADSVAEIQ